MSDRDGKIGARFPHAATIQRHERSGALPPHPAKVLQRRVVPVAVTKAVAPHPAQVARPFDARGLGVAQRARAQVVAFTGTNPITELQTMSEVFRLFAKVDDSTIQEVQAMWYKHATGDSLSLAVSANNTVGDKNAALSIGKGRTKAHQETKKYPRGAMGEAKPHVGSRSDLTFPSATVILGKSHAEQNLLAWIASRLTTESVFYIAGTKDPCTQCQPRLSGYQNRLVLAGYANMFTYHDGGVNQGVLESNVKDQVDYQTLAIP
ncbi:hypothetical protein [Polyangium sp. 15x6]|uniref:hypothetical protein n=1 Tax=Polyangium sp. 15x6 TaxID=3042687 RepID=UPI00249B82B6|nr:hypothetical protein [Polyangium sp. 15x6]MDI3289166.1 hypothetical protein [Polyangium sp. 15x6]